MMTLKEDIIAESEGGCERKGKKKKRKKKREKTKGIIHTRKRMNKKKEKRNSYFDTEIGRKRSARTSPVAEKRFVGVVELLLVETSHRKGQLANRDRQALPPFQAISGGPARGPGLSSGSGPGLSAGLDRRQGALPALKLSSAGRALCCAALFLRLPQDPVAAGAAQRVVAGQQRHLLSAFVIIKANRARRLSPSFHPFVARLQLLPGMTCRDRSIGLPEKPAVHHPFVEEIVSFGAMCSYRSPL